MSEIQTKGDLEVIFSEESVKVGEKEYVVKPWTLKQLVQAWPLLLAAFKDVKLPEGASVSDLPSFLLENPQQTMSQLLPVLIPLLSISLRIDNQEAEQIEIGPASIILLKVIGKNAVHLKNFLTLAAGEVKTLTGAMIGTASLEE
jgi:hypothetical protein